MKLKDLEKELDAEVRNKLTFPKTILEIILKQSKKVKKKDIEKAIKNIDEAIDLVKEWFKRKQFYGIAAIPISA